MPSTKPQSGRKLLANAPEQTVPLPSVLALTDPERLTQPTYITAYLAQLMEHAPTLAAAYHPEGGVRQEAFHRAHLEQGMRALTDAIRDHRPARRDDSYRQVLREGRS